MNWTAEPIEHFTLGEARCHGKEGSIFHDCELIILVPSLCRCLAHVRYHYGKPIKVKSWTRCKRHNSAVGGVKNSYHLNGHAIDIAPVDVADMDELERHARQFFSFVKRYGWGLHCDIRGERPETLNAQG